MARRITTVSASPFSGAWGHDYHVSGPRSARVIVFNKDVPNAGSGHCDGRLPAWTKMNLNDAVWAIEAGERPFTGGLTTYDSDHSIKLRTGCRRSIARHV